MALIWMASAIRRPMVPAAMGASCLLVAGLAVGVVGTASATDQYASHNVYCYASASGDNGTREFIRNVGYTAEAKSIDYVVEHQEWRDGAYSRSEGEWRSLDVSNIGNEGVLAAFNEGGDPSWVCNQFLGDGGWTGALTTEL
jgi:hypothetical protein